MDIAIAKILLGFFPGVGTLGFLAMAIFIIKDAVTSHDTFTLVAFLLLGLCSLAMAALLGSLTIFIAKLK